MNCPRLYGQHKKAPGRKILSFERSGAAPATPLQFLTDALMIMEINIVVDQYIGFLKGGSLMSVNAHLVLRMEKKFSAIALS